RRRHTRFSRDWSSDVCSSDLAALINKGLAVEQLHQPQELIGLALVRRGGQQQQVGGSFCQSSTQLVASDLVGTAAHAVGLINNRSEERRVGKEWRSRRAACH